MGREWGIHSDCQLPSCPLRWLGDINTSSAPSFPPATLACTKHNGWTPKSLKTFFELVLIWLKSLDKKLRNPESVHLDHFHFVAFFEHNVPYFGHPAQLCEHIAGQGVLTVREGPQGNLQLLHARIETELLERSLMLRRDAWRREARGVVRSMRLCKWWLREIMAGSASGWPLADPHQCFLTRSFSRGACCAHSLSLIHTHMLAACGIIPSYPASTHHHVLRRPFESLCELSFSALTSLVQRGLSGKLCKSKGGAFV